MKNNNTFLNLIAASGIAILFLSLICMGFAVGDEGIVNWSMVATIAAIMLVAGIIAYRAMTVLERREKK